MSTSSRTLRRPTPTSIAFGSVAELNAVREAARLAGKSVSRYARELLLAEANKTIAKHKRACPHCGAKNTAVAA